MLNEQLFSDNNNSNTVRIKVSAKMMRRLFQVCTKEHILNICHGKCCTSSTKSIDNLGVAIHYTEDKEKYIKMGAKIEGNFILADKRGLCPFQDNNGLCIVHNDKPIGCRFSPFNINSNNTLIIRWRCMRIMPRYSCFGGPGAIMAYKAHPWSFSQVLGAGEASRVTKLLDNGSGDIIAYMPVYIYTIMRDNDRARHETDWYKKRKKC